MAEQDPARAIGHRFARCSDEMNFVPHSVECNELTEVIRAYGDERAARARREAAEVALKVWDEGRHGAHGGEQANRTADAILAFSEPTS